MSSSRSLFRCAAAVLALVGAPRVRALQPLEAFLRSARTASPDALEARASAEVSAAQALGATGRLLPGLALRGTYARNQYAVILGAAGQTLTLVPTNQLDGYAVLTVPLVDASRFVQARAASTSERAAREQEKDTGLQGGDAVAGRRGP